MMLPSHIAAPAVSQSPEGRFLALWHEYADAMKDRREARRALREIRPQLARLLAERQDALSRPGRASGFRSFLRQSGIGRRTAYRLIREFRATTNPPVSKHINGDSGTTPASASAPAATAANPSNAPNAAGALVATLRGNIFTCWLGNYYALILHTAISPRLNAGPASVDLPGALTEALTWMPPGPDLDQIKVLLHSHPSVFAAPRFQPPLHIYSRQAFAAFRASPFPPPKPLPPGARWLLQPR